jgi:hypothetical protein
MAALAPLRSATMIWLGVLFGILQNVTLRSLFGLSVCPLQAPFGASPRRKSRM